MAEKKHKEEETKIEEIKTETPKKPKNIWMLSTSILGIIVVFLLVFNFFTPSGITGKTISESQAGEKTLDFVKNIYGIDVTLQSTSKEGDLYKIDLLMSKDNAPVTLYTTKDFSFIKLPNGYWVSIAEVTEQAAAYKAAENQTESQPQEVPKSDKPKVELFVMTHCPYGTQAEKGVLPAIKLLGTLTDSKIRFVHYFMHGDKEEQETYTQVCIREEQSSKFISYLECFLEADNSESCLTKTGVDKTKLASCKSESGKAKQYYEADKTLSQGYGVQGSPTLIINSVEVEFYPRSPANALSVICSAFKIPAEQCNNKLSEENPSPGFGTSVSSSSGSEGGSCS